MEDDKLIQDFFSEMKKNDQENIEVPAFPKQKRKQTLSTYVSSIAMVLLLVLGYVALIPKHKTNDATESISIVIFSEKSGSESLIQHENPTSDWESPTASLINDF
ncbi:hypothetical protein [Fulvivirga ligni]|uniref:hypothetical protein n=1 Tax=Fulvivirga ligni TaxID=2904246 RepID=UPI001F451240|nr:hypothetical protein [Fulvivirga ligni]UII22494.1 hypothetical protein LVD16_04535 [Fulvivirga ligni]